MCMCVHVSALCLFVCRWVRFALVQAPLVCVQVCVFQSVYAGVCVCVPTSLHREGGSTGRPSGERCPETSTQEPWHLHPTQGHHGIPSKTLGGVATRQDVLKPHPSIPRAKKMYNPPQFRVLLGWRRGTSRMTV